MNNVLLVSEKKLKSFTSLDPNMDYEEIKPYVKISQDITLQRSLGTKFMDEIMTQVINNTLTQVNRDLINNYITDLLIYDAVYRFLPSLNMKLKQQGVMRNSTEEGVGVSLNDTKYLRNEYQNLVEFYKQRLIEHLCDNPSLYPSYVNYGTQGVKPTKKNYTGGFALPKSHIRDWRNAPDSNKDDK